LVSGVENENDSNKDALRGEVVQSIDPQVVWVSVDETGFNFVHSWSVDVREENEENKEDLRSEAKKETEVVNNGVGT